MNHSFGYYKVDWTIAGWCALDVLEESTDNNLPLQRKTQILQMLHSQKKKTKQKAVVMKMKVRAAALLFFLFNWL